MDHVGTLHRVLVERNLAFSLNLFLNLSRNIWVFQIGLLLFFWWFVVDGWALFHLSLVRYLHLFWRENLNLHRTVVVLVGHVAKEFEFFFFLLTNFLQLFKQFFFLVEQAEQVLHLHKFALSFNGCACCNSTLCIASHLRRNAHTTAAASTKTPTAAARDVAQTCVTERITLSTRSCRRINRRTTRSSTLRTRRCACACIACWFCWRRWGCWGLCYFVECRNLLDWCVERIIHINAAENFGKM